MSRLITLLALGIAVVAAGCGGDDEADPETVIQTTTVTEPAPSTETTTEPETTTTDPELTTPEGTGCTDAAGNDIEIVGGGVECAAAKATAAQYDLQGAKVQEIGEWVCQGGNAQTRPVIFTCSGPGGEFTVSEATGRGGP